MQRWSTLCPPARSERWAKLLTRLMRLMRWGTLLSERFQKVLLRDLTVRLWRTWKREKRSLSNASRRDNAKSGSEFVAALCCTYGLMAIPISSSYIKLWSTYIKMKTSILGRLRGNSCSWRWDEWRSGVFPWQQSRWRHGWGVADGLQMGDGLQFSPCFGDGELMENFSQVEITLHEMYDLKAEPSFFSSLAVAAARRIQ